LRLAHLLLSHFAESGIPNDNQKEKRE